MRKVFALCVAVVLASASPSFADKIAPQDLAEDPPSLCDGLAGNLVTNCGFETGDFSGWSLGGNTGFTSVDGSFNSGNFAADLGPVGSDGFMTQAVATVPGQSYNFGFFVRFDGGTHTDFSAFWNGSSIFSVIDPAASPYTLHIFPVVATGSTTFIGFNYRDDPGFLQLDDIGVIPQGPQVPEPASLTLLGTGIAGFFAARRRRRSR